MLKNFLTQAKQCYEDTNDVTKSIYEKLDASTSEMHVATDTANALFTKSMLFFYDTNLVKDGDFSAVLMILHTYFYSHNSYCTSSSDLVSSLFSVVTRFISPSQQPSTLF